jgi:transcriptional regulator with GAF, ATPase, and Fis domain
VGDRAELLARLASAVASAPEHENHTWRMCEAARRILGADGASITMENASANRITLCATDDVAAKLENLHDVLGEGPATQAYLTGTPVVVELEEGSSAWSMFVEEASRQTPAVTLFALPMRSGSGVLGVLSLYRSTPGDLSEPLEEAGFLADALAAAVLEDTADGSDLADGGSWSNRAEVHQATGMVVAQLAVSVRDALALLRAHAFALDRDLSEVAHAVVTRQLVFRTEEGGS